jgi:tetratricopeptide (TPR) repeat protein
MPFHGMGNPKRSASGLWMAGVLFAALVSPAPTGALTTNTAAPFLSMDTGSRPASLAGAYVALADDGFSLVYNPAGLHHIVVPALAFQHNEWGLDMRQEYINAALPVGSGGLGLGLNYMSYGSIPGRDATGASTGASLTPTDLDLNLGYGVGDILPGLAAGASVHLISENLAGDGAFSLAVDLGGQYAWPDSGLGLGVAVRNLGLAISGFSLPVQAAVGAAYTAVPRVLNLSLQADLPLAAGTLAVSGGAELTVLQRVALRAGYRSVPAEAANGLHGLTAGLGVAFAPFNVSYAYQPLGSLAQSHRLTLEYALASAPAAASKGATAKSAAAKPLLFPTPTPEVGLLPPKEMPMQPSTQTLNARLTAASPEEIQEAKESYLRGQEFYKSRQYDPAIEEFQKALAIYPEYTQARRALSSAKRDRARLLLAGVMRSTSKRETEVESKRLYEQGLDLERKGREVDAAYVYKSALLLTPGDPDLTKALKRVQTGANRTRTTARSTHSEAPGEAASLIKSSPSGRLTASEEMISTLPARRTTRTETGETDESQSKAIQKHFLLGTQAFDSGDYSQAIREFELILEFDPANKQAQYKLGLSRSKATEETVAAKARAQDAKAKGDRLGEVNALRSLVLMNPGDAAARKAFTEAKQKSKQQIEELYKKGVIAYAQGNYTEAIQIWNEVLDLEPEHAKAKESIKRAHEKLELANE